MSTVRRLDRTLGGNLVYRRDHRKADGRMLYLYGRTSHDLPLLAETADDLP